MKLEICFKTDNPDLLEWSKWSERKEKNLKIKTKSFQPREKTSQVEKNI